MKKEHLRFLIIAIVVILVTMCAVLDVGGTIELEGGECKEVNNSIYDPGLNQTNYFTEDYCCIEQAVNYTETVNLDFDLIPGQQSTGELSNCIYDVSCSSCESTQETVCSRSRDLDPDERYKLDDGICDLDFYCEPKFKDCEEQDTVEQEIIIDIFKDPGNLIIEALDQKKEYNLNQTLEWSDEIKIQVECPAHDGEGNLTMNLEATYENCKTWVDHLESRNMVAYDVFAQYMSKGQADTLNFASGVMAGEKEYREQLIQCMKDVNNQSTCEVARVNVMTSNNRLKSEIKSLKSDRIWLMILAGIMFVLALIFLAKGIMQDGWFELNEVMF